MATLKLMGILVVVVLAFPFSWGGIEDVKNLHAAAGPACIIDGDEGRRLLQVTSSEGIAYQFKVGPSSTCSLGQGVTASASNTVTWRVEGKAYTQDEDYEADNRWPDPAWDWPITVTTADQMESLSSIGWQRQLYVTYFKVLPVAVLLTFLSLALFVWADGRDAIAYQ